MWEGVRKYKCKRNLKKQKQKQKQKQGAALLTIYRPCCAATKRGQKAAGQIARLPCCVAAYTNLHAPMRTKNISQLWLNVLARQPLARCNWRSMALRFGVCINCTGLGNTCIVPVT
tara:strand:- start:108 stop:455 length:348 start_codon:yes stop_codon:yes gene_type:complete